MAATPAAEISSEQLEVSSGRRRLAKGDIGVRGSDVHRNAVIDPRQQRALVLDCCRAPPQRRGKPIWCRVGIGCEVTRQKRITSTHSVDRSDCCGTSM